MLLYKQVQAYLRGSELDRIAGFVIFFPLSSFWESTSPFTTDSFSVDVDVRERRSSLREKREIDLLRKLFSSESLSESTLGSLHSLGLTWSPLGFRSIVICVISSGRVVRRAAT